ncbi:glycoprotein-N-acetylgalactosamine 3-beta-galactosyltransferase 1 isoform X1 [Drosophila virilis]|uniref:glycoprotein-N-acetylgalactosamine 3-beta-galactosyltransferase 1 isoform X1 n=2 Tax=Drosophila virilis TaxID=7244 RepID=UPI00017D32DA
MVSHRRGFHVFYLCIIVLLLVALYWKTLAQLKANRVGRIAKSGSIATQSIVADPLYDKIRVLCLVTYKYWYTDAARYVKRTWGKHCNVLLLVSGQADLELEPYVPLVNTTDNWTLVRQGLIYAFEYYQNDADWFLKIDDWSFVAVENLRYMLQKFSASEPIYLGYELKYPGTNLSFNYWKSGYVLSREALRRYTVEAKKSDSKHCMKMQGFTEDLELGRCLMNVGVVTGDTRDELGHETFIPIVTSELFIKGYDYIPWLRNMSWHSTDLHTVPISRRAITFHVSYPPRIFDLYYFMYHVRIFGKPLRNSMELLS